MRYLFIGALVLVAASVPAKASSYLCSWMDAWQLSDSKSVGCGPYDTAGPISETMTYQFQCWKSTPHNPGSSCAEYAQTNLALAGTGGCGLWAGGHIPGPGGQCNPYFSWGTSDIGYSGVTGHQAQFEVNNYKLYPNPRGFNYPSVCVYEGYQVKTWTCQAVYCQS